LFLQQGHVKLIKMDSKENTFIILKRFLFTIGLLPNSRLNFRSNVNLVRYYKTHIKVFVWSVEDKVLHVYCMVRDNSGNKYSFIFWSYRLD